MSTQQLRHATRRAIAIAGAIIVTTGALAACSSQPQSSGKTVQINVVLHDNPPTDAAFKTLTANFEKANPTIKVNLDFIPSANYAAVRTSRLAAKQVDVTEGVSGSAAVPLPSYVKNTPQSDWVAGVDAGNWVDLTGQPFLKNFIPSAMSSLEVKGKSYQVPTDFSYENLVYYNKDLFKKAGVTIPKTWNQFKNVLAKLKAQGITPMSLGGKDGWPAGLGGIGIMQSLYPTTQDMNNLDQGLWEGDVKLNSGKFVTAANEVKTLFDNTDPTFPGVDYATAEGQFASGSVAMTTDGSWAASQFLTTNPSLKMGVFPLPGSNVAKDNGHLGGKIDTTFAIPSSSKHKAAAIKWLAFFADKKNYAAYAKTGGVIPTESGVPLAASVSSLKPYINDTFYLAWDQVFIPNPKAGSNVGGIGVNYMGLAPLGSLATPQAAQDAAQTDWAAGLTQ